MAGLAFVLTRILHRPSEQEDLARRLGTQVDRSAVLAAQNRALHGRSKGERARDAVEAERLARTLDGARRDTPEED